MNHLRNGVRFIIVLFWLVVIGLIYTAIMHLGNAEYLSWATWLFYTVLATAITYAGIYLTATHWNIK